MPAAAAAPPADPAPGETAMNDRNGAIAPRPLTLSNGVLAQASGPEPSKDVAMKAWLYPPAPCPAGGKPRDGAPGGLAGCQHQQNKRCCRQLFWHRKTSNASLISSMLAKEGKENEHTQKVVR